MSLSPDNWILWEHGFFKVNATIVMTWVIMIILVLGSRLISRKLSSGIFISRWQSVLEIIVIGIKKQISEVGIERPEKYMNFLGTLFLFIAVANLGNIFPGYQSPTGSLSTTSALAISVFIAVPVFGISELGFRGYFITYLKPTFLMLPFTIISELSRTMALAIRLFGNMMSGTLIVGILVAITPFFFPVLMRTLGLLTGMVQAYIFSMLATVYIAAATQRNNETGKSIKK